MTTTHRRVAGFTLIELLVVIAILAVLSALSVGAYFRIRTGQQVKGTEDTVSKLSTALAQQWTAELETAKNAFNGKSGGPAFSTQVDNVKQIAGGDSDRALALWTYLWMKNAFPQTIPEATAATVMTCTVSGNPVSVILPPRAAFNGMTAGSLTAPDQAAAVLYAGLTAKGSRGQAFNEESVGTLSTTLPGTSMKAFTDTFGNPISFARMSSGSGDVNGPPYTKPGVSSNDPFDPAGRLLPAVWATLPTRTQAASALGLSDFSSTNWTPTIVARAAAPNWGPFLGTTTGYVPVPDGLISGYKLRRQGARGDQ